MAYSSELSRTQPACILLLIDQSGSMDDLVQDLVGSPITTTRW